MRDRCRLVADVYRPVGIDRPLPVLVQRTPYGRGYPTQGALAHAAWYARQGFIVVVQDMRGCHDSDGTFEPFVNEAADGYDTIEWAARLPGSSGHVGTYGASYAGYAQLLAAAATPPSLRAICPAISPFDARDDMLFSDGVFSLAFGAWWAAALALETARRTGNADLDRALRRCLSDIPAWYASAAPSTSCRWRLRLRSTGPGLASVRRRLVGHSECARRMRPHHRARPAGDRLVRRVRRRSAASVWRSSRRTADPRRPWSSDAGRMSRGGAGRDLDFGEVADRSTVDDAQIAFLTARLGAPTAIPSPGTRTSSLATMPGSTPPTGRPPEAADGVDSDGDAALPAGGTADCMGATGARGPRVGRTEPESWTTQVLVPSLGGTRQPVCLADRARRPGARSSSGTMSSSTPAIPSTWTCS